MEQIQYKSMSEIVFEQIQKNIITKEWKAGDRIPSESQIVKMTGASRVAVREAIQRMVGMGLLVVRQGDGTFVNELDLTKAFQRLKPILSCNEVGYRELQEYRLMTEPQIAYMAAEKANEEDIDCLDRIVTRQKEKRRDIDIYTEEDLNFHHKLAECTRNRILIAIHDATNEITNFAIKQAIITLRDYQTEYHERILEAIKKHDAEQAEKNMKEHILYNLGKGWLD